MCTVSHISFKMNLAHKLFPRQFWTEVLMKGDKFKCYGDLNDIQDGFVHLSTREQLVKTYERKFCANSAVHMTVVCLDLNNFDPEVVKWESYKGELYPHLYSSFGLNDVVWERDLQTVLSK